MERNLWTALYEAVMTVAYPEPARGVHHPDRAVVLVYLWAAVHDRPTAWACRPEHWPDDLRPAELPAQPTMSRRLRTAAVGRACSTPCCGATAATRPLTGSNTSTPSRCP